MPIQSCTLPGGGSGYRWGSGKCYPTRKQAEAQARAAYASGYSEKVDLTTLLRTPERTSLELLKLMLPDTAAHEAATSPLNLKKPPTPAQARAGNYAKGHTRVAGIPITLENAAGTQRKPGQLPLTAHYGYILRTEGADGDHVDVFVRPGTANDWVGDVYVINQVDATDRFDEHKVMVGWPDERSAVRAYLGNYPKGWKLGPVTTMRASEFRTWVREGDHKVPLRKYSEDQLRDDSGRWSGGGIPMDVNHEAHMAGHLRASNKLMQMSRDADAAGDHDKARELRSQSHQRHAMAMAHQDVHLAQIKQKETNQRRAETRARNAGKASLMGLLRKYSPDQPRDERGRWTDGGGGGGGGSAPPELSVKDVIPKDVREAAAKLLAENAGQQADVSASLTDEQKDAAAKQLAGAIKSAHADKPAFDTRLRELANDVNGTAKTAPVKGGSRLLEKHVLENASDPNQMRDLVRGSIIVNSPEDAARVLDHIKNEYTVTRVKDRFANPMATGYRDMLINVRLPSGIDGEIQVHVPEMIAAKELGHSVYNIERSTPPGPEKSAMIQLQSQIYNAAARSNRERTGGRQQMGG